MPGYYYSPSAWMTNSSVIFPINTFCAHLLRRLLVCQLSTTLLEYIAWDTLIAAYFLDFLLLLPVEAAALSLFLLPADLPSEPAAVDLPPPPAALVLLADLEAADDLAFLRSSFSLSSSSVFSLSISVISVLHLLWSSYNNHNQKPDYKTKWIHGLTI